MGCSNCGSGGCGTTPAGCRNNGNCGTSGCNKLEVFDWLAGMQLSADGDGQFVEVRFKNTRKEFFKNPDLIDVHVGEPIVVEAVTGFDVGTVSLTGELVKFQMKKYGVKPQSKDVRKVYRKATDADLEKWREAQSLERETMIKTRKIVRDLNLNMKLSDVEYQADKNRCTFYYIADDRVDFRELIKVLADQFRVRVEMRQIGSRQEAGRVGGIGSCGRELCCTTWLTDFRTVSTTAARYQQLSINPMKLAGQCGKLKCCLNYELDSYMDAIKQFPDHKVKLKTKRGVAFHQKSDIFKGMMWYSYIDAPSEFIPIKVDRVRELISLNQRGKEVEDLTGFTFREEVLVEEPGFDNVVGQEDVTRFDKKNNKNRSRNRGKGNRGGQQASSAQPNTDQKPRPAGQKPRPENANAAAEGGRRPADQPRPEGSGKKKSRNRNRGRGGNGPKPTDGGGGNAS